MRILSRRLKRRLVMAIRELTKSILSFSWAMTLFPVQQALNIVRPSKAAESFDNVTKATREEFSEATDAVFRPGDNLLRGMVDLTLGVLSLQAFNPTTWVNTASDAAQRTARAAADVSQRTARAGADVAEQTARAASGVAERTAKATSDVAERTAGTLRRVVPETDRRDRR
jgi:hypothetical protein